MSSSAPDPIRLKLPLPFPVAAVNAYLLRGDPLTLVDPGLRWPTGAQALEAGLAEHGLRVEDIEQVIVTHQHDDHLGLAETVRRRAQCPVAAHELVADLMADEPAARAREDEHAVAMMTLHGIPGEIAQTVATISATTSDWAESLVVDRRLRAGDEIDAGGRRYRVALRPGHSPTDTLFLAPDGVALVGDHLLRDHAVVLLAHRPPTGAPDPRRRPRAVLDYRHSLSATAADEIRIAHPGHGPPIDDVGATIDTRLAKQDEHALRVAEMLRDGPKTAWEVVQTISAATEDGAEHPVALQFIALSNVLARLDLLVDRGRAHELDDGELIRFALHPPVV